METIEKHNSLLKRMKHSKWLRGWRLALLITLSVAIIVFIFSLIFIPVFRDTITDVIGFIFALPFGIIMFFAYFDDMIARK
ncbi:MAG TPA: hypothetical protein DDX40_06010 [Rikenellaceae bacterium]|nr:hypothetical protein [Rikenellaceae bacterium]